MRVMVPGFNDYIVITRRRFFYSLVIAFVLHTIFFASMHYAPREEVIDIPVKTLKIKLGSALSSEEEALLQEEASVPEANNEQIESSLQNALAPPVETAEDKISMDEMTPAKQKVTPENNKRQVATGQEGISISQVARQYVREREPTATTTQTTGNTLGNKVEASQVRVQAYTQTIALWLDKFKVYPEEAKAAGMQGRAMVRIRIDRRGNVHYRILSERTAYPLLDKAVLDMVRRANPVPPVPADYPVVDEYLEFVIPVSFKLD